MKRGILGLCVVVLLLTGCGLFARRAALKNCEFSLRSVDLADYTLTDMTLAVGVAAKNTNDIAVTVDRLKFEFFINGKRAFEGSMGQGVNIAPGKTETLNTSLTFNYVELGVAIGQAVKEKQAKYDMRGTAYLSSSIGTFAFPFFVSR
ncbi:MAG: LEA type 2 family protein [bacterium]